MAIKEREREREKNIDQCSKLTAILPAEIGLTCAADHFPTKYGPCSAI